MKKIVSISVCTGFLLIGCAQKPMATSVVELAGNQTVIGWNDNKTSNKLTSTKKPKTQICKTEIKYKYLTEKDSDGDWVPDSVDKCPDTPPNMEVNHYGCPIISTLRFNFDFNSAYIKKIYYPQIKKVADILKNNPHLKIEIAGYTDNIGSDEYNKKLSLKRAQAVKNILVKYGINPNRIIIKGYGKKYPLVPNTTSTNRALNRRVEIVDITNKK
jgi:OOP family OmpA-OmpF porin